MMTEARVSVIIPYFNNGAFIDGAIASIHRQGIEAETILVDDGSGDDIAARVRGWDGVTYLRQENRGPAAARNTGIRHASGEMIAFLDADDYWPDGKLARQLARFAQAPELGVVTGGIEYAWLGVEQEKLRFQERQTSIHIHMGAAMVRRRVFDAIGLFDEAIPFDADLDWLLRAHEQEVNMAILDETMLICQRHGANMSRHVGIRDTQVLAVIKRSLDRRRAKHGKPVALRSLFGIK